MMSHTEVTLTPGWHSKCIVTEDFKRQLRLAMEADATFTYQTAGYLLGVSGSIVRSWIAPISPRVRT